MHIQKLIRIPSACKHSLPSIHSIVAVKFLPV
jgi:hypothetical protein